eukprot:6197843-Pleurochrysis_carterae.AAC.3
MLGTHKFTVRRTSAKRHGPVLPISNYRLHLSTYSLRMHVRTCPSVMTQCARSLRGQAARISQKLKHFPPRASAQAASSPTRQVVYGNLCNIQLASRKSCKSHGKRSSEVVNCRFRPECVPCFIICARNVSSFVLTNRTALEAEKVKERVSAQQRIANTDAKKDWQTMQELKTTSAPACSASFCTAAAAVASSPCAGAGVCA